MDQKTDPRHHQNHDSAQGIEQKSPIRLKRRQMPVGHVKRHPCHPSELDHLMDANGKLPKLPHRAHRKHKRKQHHPRADEIDEPP